MKTELADRSERLLALLLVQQVKTGTLREKVKLLSLAGYSNVEISDLLETSPAVVASTLYEARKAGKKRTASSRRPRDRDGGSSG